MSPLPSTFTPGLPPAGSTIAFIGRDAQGSLYLLRWHDTNGWEALGWIGAGQAAMPALRHPAGEDQGLIVAHVRVPGIPMAADDWSYAFDGSTLRDRFGGSFMASEPDANGNVSVLMSQAEAHAIIAALGQSANRMCVACGRTVDAAKVKPGDELPECRAANGYSACLFDLTAEEAWQFWRQKYHELRDGAAGSAPRSESAADRLERTAKALCLVSSVTYAGASLADLRIFLAEAARLLRAPPVGEDRPVGHVTIDHDGFAGDIIGHYTTREGKRGVVVQQDRTRVVHVYGEKWIRPARRCAICSGEHDNDLGSDICQHCEAAVSENDR